MRGRGNTGFHAAPQVDEELKCREMGGGWPMRTTGPQGLARSSPLGPESANRPGWGSRKGEAPHLR